jgi:hypothetical protein
MAMVTYPLNNVQYNAEDAELYNAVRMSGVWGGAAFDCEATGNDTIVTIGEGLAWIANTKFSGKVVAQKEPIAINLGTADPSYNRIDVIAIQFDSVENRTDIIVKKGVASPNPEIPARSTTESLYELYLYSVLRKAGSSAVSKSNITDLRDNRDYCGYMQDSIKPGYAPSLMEHNKCDDFRFWVGSKEEYKAKKDTLPANTFCIITNDNSDPVEDETYIGCYYRMVGGKKEWINPPMEADVEYRTTERHNGFPVCKKLVNLGLMPNASAKIFSIAVGNGRLVNVEVFANIDNESRQQFPIIAPSTDGKLPYITAHFSTVKGSLILYTMVDYSPYTAYAILTYTTDEWLQ